MMMIDDVLTEHGRLLHVLPFSVHCGDHSETFLLFEFFCGTLPSCLNASSRVVGWVGGRWHP